MNTSRTILGCPPVQRKKQRAIGILAFKPLEGSVKGFCDICSAEVWIGPKLAAAKSQLPNNSVVCFGCAIKSDALKGETKVMGAQSHEYLVDWDLIK